MITDDVLAELERKARAATPGPWTHCVDDDNSSYVAAGELVVCEVAQAFSDNLADGDFIAAADPPAVLALVAEVLRLRAAGGRSTRSEE